MPKSESALLLAFSVAIVFTFACSAEGEGSEPLSQGGRQSSGAGAGNATGGAAGAGGASSGGQSAASGGASSGAASGGASSGGQSAASGGASNGGRSAANGGVGNSGGSATSGGVSSGGRSAASGGASSGGRAATNGGTSAGGTAPSGGASAAGAGSCDWSEPPANVSGWIEESYSGQLGDNLRNRKVWLLDSAMMGKGQINLCVRWGATSAVPSSLATNLASTVERWFNDWFKSLGSYGCFPYPEGVRVKVTGWAVKPGQQALLAGVDTSIPVYTGVDADGEPKCPDNCSFFVNPSHKFPNCAAGEENHSDYWLWFDDKLPGNSGAAAVGGDWGLRMPVNTFTNNFEAASFMIVEHEMGHGFGFQDYYDWTGSKPNGGSIMIVGSTNSQKPTLGDQWILRRAWKESKALRGW